MFAGLQAPNQVAHRPKGSELQGFRDVCRPEMAKTKSFTGLEAVSIRCVCRPTGSKPSSSQA